MTSTEETLAVKQAHAKNVAGFTAFLNSRDDEAEPLFLAAVEEMRNAGYEGLLLAGALGHLAFLYFVHHRPRDAERYFQEALEVHEKISFVDGLSASILLGHYGDFYRRQKKYAQAEALFQRSIALCERDWGIKSRFLPGNCLNFYCELLEDVGRKEEAEEMRALILEIEGSGHERSE